MRGERISTHLTCNQNCTYCLQRRATDDPAYVSGLAVRGRIDAALARGAEELTLSGGEPTMRRDLAQLIAHARRGGAKRVFLETNATLIDGELAQRLRDAGLSAAHVNLTALDGLDAITRDPGGAQRSLAGLRALIATDIAVDLYGVLIRSTLRRLPALPQGLAAALGSLAGIRTLYVRTPIEAPNPTELVSYIDAAAAIAELDKAARAVGLSLRIAPDGGPPPCTFAHLGATRLYFSLTPGSKGRAEHKQFPVCEQCLVADRCSGLPMQYLKRYPPPPMTPIGDDRVRRRLSLIASVEDQVDRELLSENRTNPADGSPPGTEHLIRVNFHCNQSCRFCFVSTHLPNPDDARIRAQIVDSAQAGHDLVLTGGEPTLHPQLVDYVRLARAHSDKRLTLQTNATRLADETLTVALAEAGLDTAFVSLHGCCAETSDAITETPGTFDKTVAGLDALRRLTQVHLIVNFVICQRNHHELPEYVRWVHSRWPGAEVNLSFVAPSSDLVPRDTALIPKYSDVLPDLVGALREGQRLGIGVIGFEAMCGIPLCLVPPEFDGVFRVSAIPQGYDAGEFVRGEACEGCVYNGRCYGLRRGYRDLYGDGELLTMTREVGG